MKMEICLPCARAHWTRRHSCWKSSSVCSPLRRRRRKPRNLGQPAARTWSRRMTTLVNWRNSLCAAGVSPSSPRAAVSGLGQEEAGLSDRVELEEVAEEHDDWEPAERAMLVAPVLAQAAVHRRERETAHLADLVDDQHGHVLPPQLLLLRDILCHRCPALGRNVRHRVQRPPPISAAALPLAPVRISVWRPSSSQNMSSMACMTRDLPCRPRRRPTGGAASGPIDAYRIR